MYIEGKCSDLSFTYNGRPPVTPLAVLDYMDRVIRSDNNRNIVSFVDAETSLDGHFSTEGIRRLQERIHTPRTTFRFACDELVDIYLNSFDIFKAFIP